MEVGGEGAVDGGDAFGPGLCAAGDGGVVGFVEGEVVGVPFGVGDGGPGAGVDGVDGVVFHEFHGGVGAGDGVPGAGFDEGGGGGVGHLGLDGWWW